MGAALLAVHGAAPVFASAIGVRIADRSGDQFAKVFEPNERLTFGSKECKFFVSDASSGVARLLVCDQDDPVRQPGGRLLRVIPVPIDTDEDWLDVRFTLDRHLVLNVEPSGRRSKARLDGPVTIEHLNLGFRLPPQAR